MARMMNINVLGVVENMSYLSCPKCNEKIPVFGESHLDEFASKMDFKVLGKLPIVSANATKVDKGQIEDIELKEFESITDAVIKEGDK